MKTYTELIKLSTFEERFEYLKMSGKIGIDTFGHDRYLNQIFYNSQEWRNFRNKIIIRDNGCDLGIEDRPILRKGLLLIHHMNPVTKEQLLARDPDLMNPEYVIVCMKSPTHEAIHYGDSSLLVPSDITVRTKNDTCLWK